MATLRKEFGKIFVMFLFHKAYLVTLEPTIVRRVLSDTKAFVKGVDYSEQFSLVFGDGLVTSRNDKHKADRAIFGKYFIRGNIAKYMPSVCEISNEAIDQLIDGEMGSAKSLTLDIEFFFARLALREFMNFAAGTTYRNDLPREKEICKIVSDGSCAMGNIIMFSIPQYDFMPYVKTARSVRTELWKDFEPIVEERRKLMQSGQAYPDDCITAMIEANMSEIDIIDHTVTMISAGHDTTAYFSAYVCLLLAEHQDVQEKLRNEIFEQLGDRIDISADEITGLKYLHQVLQECLRLYAIIPCVTRYATTDVTIKDAGVDGADVTIPKGTDVMIPMYLLNRDPSIWTNPSKFDPDRFEGKGDYTNARAGFFPFGYGSRTCIGNTLAQLEASVFMCHLLRRFRFRPEPGFKININAGISLTTSNGVRVVLERV